MAYGIQDHTDEKIEAQKVVSYDTGFEHSLEHLIYVRQLVDEEEVVEEIRVAIAS